jgi:hypothetical protein
MVQRMFWKFASKTGIYDEIPPTLVEFGRIFKGFSSSNNRTVILVEKK